MMLFAAANAANSTDTFASRVDCACSALSQKYPSSLLTPTSANYSEESKNYWDIRASFAPACIFFPTSADEVSAAVTTFVSCKAQFAIRGGGHMNVGLPEYQQEIAC